MTWRAELVCDSVRVCVLIVSTRLGAFNWYVCVR